MRVNTAINTYMPVSNEADLRAALAQFGQLLEDLGYYDLEARDTIAVHSWEDFVSDISSRGFASHTVVAGEEAIEMQPAMYAYTPIKTPGLATSLIEFELYFDIWPYEACISAGLWDLLHATAFAFPASGAFLAPDAVSEWPWQALLAGAARRELWSFDLALIPRELIPYFTPLHPDYQRANLPEGVGLARVDCWPVLPWNATTVLTQSKVERQRGKRPDHRNPKSTSREAPGLRL